MSVAPVVFMKHGSKLPGPKGLAWIRACRALHADPYRALDQLIAAYGDVFGVRLGRQLVVVVSSPELADEVLTTHAPAYGRSSSYRQLRTLLGDGLLSAEGERWRTHRRAVQPAFRREQVLRVIPSVVETTRVALARWERETQARGTLNAMDALLHLGIEIAVRALLGVDPSADEVEGLFTGMTVRLGVRNTDSRRWLPWGGESDADRAAESLRAHAATLIARRGSLESGTGADFLGYLLTARDAGVLSPSDVVDEVLNFLAAGHETAAYALTWTLHLLSQRPELQAQIAAEARGPQGRPETGPAGRGGLSLTRRVLLESMRLYPPVWALEREPLSDQVLGGYRIPRGATVVVNTHAIHRSPAHWERPERFDPDRFLHARCAGRHATAYLPFGRGQRQCIGEAMAMLEMQAVLGLVISAFEIAPSPDHSVTPKGGVTLRPRDGLHLLLRLRRGRSEERAA